MMSYPCGMAPSLACLDIQILGLCQSCAIRDGNTVSLVIKAIPANSRGSDVYDCCSPCCLVHRKNRSSVVIGHRPETKAEGSFWG